MKKNSHFFCFLLLLIFLLPVTIQAQLSGTKTIGGSSPDYPTVKAAISALNTQGVTAPGVTFLIRSGTYAEDSLRIRTSTSNASAPIIFKPDVGATVVINVSPPNTTYNFAIKIDTTQYITIDGSNNGTTSRDLTINSTGVNGQRGIWVSGASHYATIKNCNINAGKDIAAPTTAVRCIDFLYTGATQDPDNILCENNFLRYAYTGVRMEGNVAGDVIENAIIRNNVIDSVANAGIYTHYQNNSMIYGNDVNVLRGSSATMYGIYVGTVSSNVKVYSNAVHDMNQLSTTSVTYGIYNGASSTTGINSVYNNFVRAINVPATGTGAMYGIYDGTGNTATPDVIAFNTVYLTGASTGNRITSAFYKGSATGPANVYNNIFYNTRTDGTTGVALAIYKTSTATVLSSNNNNLFVGTPDALHQTGRISTTNYATVALWGAANNGSDGLSFTENSPFVSSTNLHIQTTVPTQLESGGIPVAGITDDIDGNVRNVTTPDIGGDEFAGIALDLTPPLIAFTPLPHTSSTSPRTLNAVISDVASGVPTAGIGLPVLYWRINSGSWNAATAVYLSGSDYQFNFGAGVVLGDTVKYYICAQDGASTPNVTSNPLAGAGGFTANPPAAAIPPTTPASYRISDVALSGDYTVGIAMFNLISGKNIYFEKVVQKVWKEVEVISTLKDLQPEKGIESTSTESTVQSTITKQLMEVEETTWVPMESGQPYKGDLYVKKIDHPEINFPDGTDGIYLTITAAVADLNLRGVSGPVRFLLTDASYSTGETYPITISIANENQTTSTNTVTFKPNTGVTSVITGGTAQNIFGVYNNYIIFDGSNTVGGTTRDLTIVNTFTGGSFNLVIVVWHNGVQGATNTTVKNCIIEGTPTTTSSYGLFLNAGGGGFHNTSFINNKIQNVKIGIQFAGVAGNVSNDGFVFGNIIGDATKPVKLGGILGSQVNNLTIEGNEIFGEAAGNTNTSQYGVALIAGSTNSKVRKNNIHDFYYTGTSGYGCFGIRYNAEATTFTEISNNVIHNIKGDGDATSLTYTPAGIYIISGGNVNVLYNSIYMSGNTLGQGTTYTGRSGCLTIAASITLLDIRDNIFQNSMGSFPGSTMTNVTFGVYCLSANTAFTDINYNDYYVNGINPYVGYLGANQVDLTAWRAATGKDLNSLSADPLYQSTTDLRPTYNSPVIAAGTPIAGITTDFLGVTRSATNPTIGAYEQGVITPIPPGTYTVGLSAFMQATGKRIYFETRTRTVTRDLLGNDSHIDLLAKKDEKNSSGSEPGLDENDRYVTVTEEYLEMMEDGKPFDYSFFKSDQSMGVYPTITSAITDLVLRGIAGPVTFLLVDTNYPTETYPLLIPAIVGVTATNTITFKPGPGVQANIPGSTTQPTSTFQLGGARYVTIDGSNTVGGTTKDLHITCPVAFPAFHFYGGATHNTVLNTIFDSKYTSTSSGTFLFGATASGDSNYVGNCTMTKSDTSAVRQGVGIYFFASNTSTFNRIVGCDISEFNNYGIRPQGAPSTNNLIKGNHIYHMNPATTSVYGIYISRQPGLVVEENYIENLRSTLASPTIIGIYYLGSSGNPVDIYVRNNVVSLSADVTQPAGTLRGIDYFAYAANSAEIYFNSIYIGGSGVTGGTTTGLSKRDATTSLKMYDNAVYNTRSNGTGTGKHYAVYFSNTTAPFEMNNNDYYTDGTGGVLGYFGTTDQTTLAAWQSVTLQDANSISADPIFVSNLDYRPQAVSPLLSAGLTIPGITTDILGDLRGTPPTIGAYENGVFVAINTPSNLVALADTFTVDLSWQDNSNNEFGFVIQRKDGDSLSVNPFVTIDTVNTNDINYLDTGLNPNTTYTYRVFGYNSAGNSGFSNMAVATTFIPVEFSLFTAEVAGRDVLVNWTTATELNNLGFDIERKMDAEWEKVGFKDGKGTTTEESHYSFIDKFTYESYVGSITYRLKQMDFDGTYTYSNEIEVTVDFTPKEYTLYQNYPNPFNPVTTIKYSLPFESNVRIAVYNILGEMIEVLVDETKQVGFHDFNWNASNLASGIYIYTIEAKSVGGDKNYSSVKKMILMK